MEARIAVLEAPSRAGSSPCSSPVTSPPRPARTTSSSTTCASEDVEGDIGHPFHPVHDGELFGRIGELSDLPPVPEFPELHSGGSLGAFLDGRLAELDLGGQGCPLSPRPLSPSSRASSGSPEVIDIDLGDFSGKGDYGVKYFDIGKDEVCFQDGEDHALDSVVDLFRRADPFSQFLAKSRCVFGGFGVHLLDHIISYAGPSDAIQLTQAYTWLNYIDVREWFSWQGMHMSTHQHPSLAADSGSSTGLQFSKRVNDLHAMD